MVEMGGIEPPSEEASPQGATSVVCDLNSLTLLAHKQAYRKGSFIMHGPVKAFRTHVDHLDDTRIHRRGNYGRAAALIRQRQLNLC